MFVAPEYVIQHAPQQQTPSEQQRQPQQEQSSISNTAPAAPAAAGAASAPTYVPTSTVNVPLDSGAAAAPWDGFMQQALARLQQQQGQPVRHPAGTLQPLLQQQQQQQHQADTKRPNSARAGATTAAADTAAGGPVLSPYPVVPHAPEQQQQQQQQLLATPLNAGASAAATAAAAAPHTLLLPPLAPAAAAGEQQGLCRSILVVGVGGSQAVVTAHLTVLQVSVYNLNRSMQSYLHTAIQRFIFQDMYEF
jgi:hypothetical protein